ATESAAAAAVRLELLAALFSGRALLRRHRGQALLTALLALFGCQVRDVAATAAAPEALTAASTALVLSVLTRGSILARRRALSALGLIGLRSARPRRLPRFRSASARLTARSAAAGPPRVLLTATAAAAESAIELLGHRLLQRVEDVLRRTEAQRRVR